MQLNQVVKPYSIIIIIIMLLKEEASRFLL